MSQENNIYAPPLAETQEKTQENLQGLGGWLILVGIIVVLTPFRMGADLYTSYQNVFTNGTWELLTDPKSTSYLVYFKSFVIFEGFINILMLITCFIVIYLFSLKRSYLRNF